MTSKAAVEIPHSAVVCLSVGLLLGSVLLPEQHGRFPEYKVPGTPNAETTLVDGEEGRLLERSPISAVFPKGAQDVSGKADDSSGSVASKELSDLAQHKQPAWHYQISTAPSTKVVMVLCATFALLGLIVQRIDFLDIRDEDRSPPCLRKCNHKEQEEETSGDASALVGQGGHRWKHVAVAFSVLATVGVLLSAVVSQLPDVLDASAEKQSADELTVLMNPSEKLTSPLAADAWTLLWVGGCAVMSICCMLFDHQEMAAEMHDARNENEITTIEPPSAPHQRTKSMKVKSAYSWNSIAVSTGVLLIVITAWMLYDRLGNNGNADSAESDEANELSNLVRPSTTSSSHLSDGLVVGALTVCCAVGLAIMRVDFRDMVRELEDQPDDSNCKAPAASAQVPREEKESTQPESAHSWRWVAAVTALLVAFSAWMVCNHLGSAESIADVAGTDELSNLARSSVASLSHLPDYLVMGALTVFGALGVGVMHSDFNDELDQLEDKRDGKDCSVSCQTSTVFVGPACEALLRHITRISIAAAMMATCSIAWTVSPSNLLECIDSLIAYQILDKCLLMALSAALMIGLACMRVDVMEMASQVEQE